jgi:adenylate cyclase
MDTAIFESLERVRLRQVLGRSVDPRVMQRLLANPDVGFLKGERLKLSVLYADIRGSTSLAERTEPELLVGFINAYLSRMTEVILANEGTLDKFVGDEVMALFGAPFHQPDHALRAVRVGLKMQTAHQEVMESWRAQGVDAAPIGIGIASGEMTVGEMGSAQRSDYTVIGRPANLGARICSAAKAGQVLISQATYDMVAGQVEAAPVTGLDLKGIGNDVTVYHVARMSD